IHSNIPHFCLQQTFQFINTLKRRLFLPVDKKRLFVCKPDNELCRNVSAAISRLCQYLIACIPKLICSRQGIRASALVVIDNQFNSLISLWCMPRFFPGIQQMIDNTTKSDGRDFSTELFSQAIISAAHQYRLAVTGYIPLKNNS